MAEDHKSVDFMGLYLRQRKFQKLRPKHKSLSHKNCMSKLKRKGEMVEYHKAMDLQEIYVAKM